MLGERVALQTDSRALLLRIASTKVIGHREVELVCTWSPVFYILVSLSQQGTFQTMERETWILTQSHNFLFICPACMMC